ncbi:MAG TPA: polysaccharide deacetylase family protein [Bacillales bacterium]
MRTFMMVAAAILLLTACSGQPVSKDADTGAQKGKPAQQDKNDNKGAEPQGKETAKGDGMEKSGTNGQKNEEKGDQNKEKANQGKPVKPKYYMNENYFIKPIDDANPKVVLLTIDDSPNDHAVEMAKTLKSLDAKAIFFINNCFTTDKNERLKKLKKIHQMGFPIGNHTVTHLDLQSLSKEKQREEIIPIYKEIKQVTGEPTEFFRAPYGHNTDLSDKLAAERGALVMNWVYGYDWHQKYQDPEALTEIMLNPEFDWMLSNGAILLMHDHPWTAKALDDIVKGLRKKGYTILDPALLKTPQSGK